MQSLFERLRQREDTEHEQIMVKVSVGLLLVVYALIIQNEQAPLSVIIVPPVLYILSSLLLLGWILYEPGIYPARRIFSIVLDVVFIGYTMLVAEPVYAFMFCAYISVTFGYGFRFGNRYLLYASILCIAGFVLVIFFSTFWSTHLILASGVIITLLVISVYAGALITRLQNAVTSANKANRAKSQFLANMSHEIRTPLNGVIAMSEMLAKTPLNETQKDFTSTIQGSANNLLSVINDILDIAKIETGRTDIIHADFDLHRLVNSTAQLFANQAREKGLQLDIHISAEIPFLLSGDQQHIRQVLINLLSNAIKFTDTGHIGIFIEPGTELESGRNIRFRITDTGIGIAEEAAGLIFEKFTQADDSIMKKYGGSGLGMAIARQLVEAMGGQIGFHSKPGSGSTFWFELCLEPQGIQSEEESALGDIRGQRILVINPEPQYSYPVEKQLAAWGISVVRVSGTDKAGKFTERKNRRRTGLVFFFQKFLDDDPEYFIRANRDTVEQGCRYIYISDHPLPDTEKKRLLNAGYTWILPADPSRIMLFRTVHAAVSPAQSGQLPGETPQDKQLANLDILVGEDNPVNQKVIRTILEHDGHRVTLMEKGEQVLVALDKHMYDIVILDLHMPEMSGLEVFRIFRFTWPDRKHIPFIMLTANATREAWLACKEAGIDAFLTKPVRPRHLLDTIQSLLANRESVSSVLTIKDNGDLDQPDEISEVPLLDDTALRDIARMSNNREFLSDLITEYINNTSLLIEQIHTLLSDRKTDEIYAIAHNLKGSSTSIGAMQLSTIAHRLCNNVHHEDLQTIASTIEELVASFHQTCRDLDSYINPGKPTLQ